jgi:hypothetical protein
MRIQFVLAWCGLLAASAIAAPARQAQSDPAARLGLQREQTAQLAADWIHSGDPRLVAWGAYVVLRDDRVQFIPDLLEIMRAHEVTSGPLPDSRMDEHDEMLAVLDALIQLRAEAPEREAARLYPEFPAQSLILLTRDGKEADNSLLEIFRAEHSQRLAWLAAGNLLAQRRVPGFAAAVLGNLTVQAEIRVTDSDRPGVGKGSGGSCGSGLEGRANWPVVGTYTLAEKAPEAILLADGADPVYYFRTVIGLPEHDNKNHCGLGSSGALNLNIYREHYLATLLSVPQWTRPLKSSISQTIIWENSDAYLAFLRNLVQQEQTSFNEVTRRLKDAGLLTAEEAATVKPRFEIAIVDDRDDKKTRLPDVGKLGENVTVKM